jgi:hypothetical protein
VAPDRWVKLRQNQGFDKPGTGTTQVTGWLKADHKPGHGHAMAIVKLLKDRGVFPRVGDLPRS